MAAPSRLLHGETNPAASTSKLLRPLDLSAAKCRAYSITAYRAATDRRPHCHRRGECDPALSYLYVCVWWFRLALSLREPSHFPFDAFTPAFGQSMTESNSTAACYLIKAL